MAVVVFFGVGRWLVKEDPLEKANAIAVLSGSMPLRAIEAAKLFREGYARKVWLTRASNLKLEQTLNEMHIPFKTEDYYNSQILMHEGVAAQAIHVLEPSIDNTANELRAISSALVKEKGGSVIIVTTKVHTRRVRTLWRRLSGGRSRAIVRASSEDPFDPGHWWRTTTDALDVVREILGLLNAWAGLPLQPAK